MAISIFKNFISPIILAVGLALSLAVPALAQPDARDFFEQFSQVQISPDGNYIATLRPYEGRNALVIQAVDGSDVPTVIPAGESIDILSYAWASNERLIISAGWAQLFRPANLAIEGVDVRLMAVNRDGTELENLGRYSMGNVVDMLRDDPDHILIQDIRRHSFSLVMRVLTLNIHDGAERIVDSGRADFGDFVTDTRGNVRALIDADHNGVQVWVRDVDSVDWRRIHRSEHFVGQAVRPLKVLYNGRYLYLFSNHEGRTGLYRYDLEQETGGFERVYLDDRYDMSYFVYDPDTDRPLYVAYMADLPQRHYFDEDAERLHNTVNRVLPGTVERVTDSDRAGNRHVIVSSGPGEPPVYYLMDEAAGTITEIASSYPNLDLADMAAVEAFSYPARDGTDIPSYLAVPGAIDGPPYPLVVWPHGGPHARRDQDFFMLRQFIATRGYAMFMPNFRGSTGYGNEFYRDGWREWGGLMQTDVTDGVQYLIDEGIADPDRICIVGWSYGAYSALMGAVQTPELYRCAIAINGVYDLVESQRELGRDFQRGAQLWWRNTMGDDPDELARVSPARRADEIRVPVLIIFAEEDRNIPHGQHGLMVNAMREAGVRYEERVFEEGDHSMSYGPSMQETLELVESFLERNL